MKEFWLQSILVLGCFLPAFLQASNWNERKRAYKPRTLRTDRLIRIGKLSDGSQLDYFKNEILRPFLRVRTAGTEGNLLVRQHIRDQMNSLGWTIEEDAFNDTTPLGVKPFNNIVAVHRPSAMRRLTLACHFDSKYFTNFDFIGATDSAVPCALLIDLARLLSASLSKNCSSEVTLQFMFFDGEEAFGTWTETDSIYGARHLAEKMAATFVEVEREVIVSQLETIDIFILLDLIGAPDMSFISYFSSTQKYYERLQKLELRMAKEGLLEPVDSFRSSNTNKYFSSYVYGYDARVEDDHIPFLQRNVPILHLISHPFPRVWHTVNDNEAALDYTTINNFGKILRCFVVEYLHLSV